MNPCRHAESKQGYRYFLNMNLRQKLVKLISEQIFVRFGLNYFGGTSRCHLCCEGGEHVSENRLGWLRFRSGQLEHRWLKPRQNVEKGK